MVPKIAIEEKIVIEEENVGLLLDYIPKELVSDSSLFWPLKNHLAKPSA